ncbi:Huntingtin-interacting protein K-like protein [Dinothrombium tinctorium]|uniref:Huntingtin-interacting protein K-like protein n=1 Tax=Dinothrombium tinctorium TaxID=1965070 RepID=A0A3S4R9J9_9ACAR|nr:Huntingtin-interacting protein K-like protein [Dinothrombium tinctorium]
MEENTNANGINTEASLDNKPQKKAAKHDSGAADLEKVTDYVEEKEISSQDITGAISFIGDKRSKETAERAARQKELAKVTIKKEDVELIVKELEINRSQAELKLREYNGNVVQALIALTD